jgi:tetratricopeptide (TPR) repeat protein
LGGPLRTILLLIIFIFWNASCFGSKLIIKSRPENADIYIVNDEAKPIKIGATPYETDLNELINSYVKSDSFIVEVKKDGHLPYRLLLAKTANVDMRLSASLELDPSIPAFKDHDILMNQLFDVQRLMRSKNFNDAIKILSDLEIKHPRISVIPELMATAYYMNRDIEKSLSYYRKAFSVNPDNSDAYKMKIYLEKKLGVAVDK